MCVQYFQFLKKMPMMVGSLNVLQGFCSRSECGIEIFLNRGKEQIHANYRPLQLNFIGYFDFCGVKVPCQGDN